MKKVYKYELAIDDYVSISMPKGSKILHLDLQYGRPFIWALVDPDAEEETRNFRVAGTGHEIGDTYCQRYIGSFMLMNGALVFHVFEY